MLFVSFFCRPVLPLLYIDPATSTYFIQIVAGIIISCGVLLGVFRAKMALFFHKFKIKRMEKKIIRETKKENLRGLNDRS